MAMTRLMSDAQPLAGIVLSLPLPLSPHKFLSPAPTCGAPSHVSFVFLANTRGNSRCVPAGSYARNPVNQEAVPIWVADYVLGSYGSGAIMAVPAHDSRDYDFAQQFGLPVRQVVQPHPPSPDLPFTGSLT